MKDLYQETFSHVRSSYEFNMEDFEKMKTKHKRPIKMAVLLAAVVGVMAALAITASATGFFGLSALVMPQEREDKEKNGEYITLQGYADSAESRAIADYQYNGLSLEEAAKKYGLTVLDRCDVFQYDDLKTLLGGDIFDGRHQRWASFVYENGSFGMDGNYTSGDTVIGYQLFRAVKGAVADTMLYIGDLGDYAEWSIPVGERSVALALGQTKSLVIADLGDCFFTVNVLTGSLGSDLDGTAISAEDLEEFAKSFNYSVLATVAVPDLGPEAPQVVYGAGVELDPQYILEDQSFDETLPGWGKTRFITYLPTPEFDDVRFFLSRDGAVSDYEFHPMFNEDEFQSVAALSFEDLTGDGKVDVLALVDYRRPDGTLWRDLRIFQYLYDQEYDLAADLIQSVLESVPAEKLTVKGVRSCCQELIRSQDIPTGDSVLLTLDVPIGQDHYEVDYIGRELNAPALTQFGVREMRIYKLRDGIRPPSPTQTIVVADIGEDFVSGAWGEGCTECWSLQEIADVQDMNFDGEPDLGLFGWITNNTIPHYYWFWDSASGQFKYAMRLQGAQVDYEAKTVTEVFRSGGAGGGYTYNIYKPDGKGGLTLAETRHEDPVIDMPEDEGQPKTYQELVRALDKETSGSAWHEYALYDMDGNGQQELLARFGTCEADASARVYSIYKGGLTVLGEFGMGHAMLYAGEDGALLRVTGQMGYEEIDRLTIKGPDQYGIEEERISERELETFEAYATPGEALMWADYSDMSLLTDMTYADILEAAKTRFGGDGVYLKYYIADIENDGVKELFLHVENGDWRDAFYVYTQKDGRALPLGQLTGRKTSLASDGETLYLDYLDPTEGSEIVYTVSVTSGAVTTQVISHKEGLDPEDLMGSLRLGAKALKSYDIDDRSGL